MKFDLLREQFDCCLGDGDFAGASALVDSSLAANPGDARIHALKGTLMESMGRLKDALSAFQQASRLAPKESEFLYWQCEILLMLYQVQETIQLCGRGAELFPADYRYQMVEADAWLWSVPVLGLSGDDRATAIARGQKILDAALKLRPADGEIRVVEGMAHLMEGDAARCRESFEMALKYGLELFGDCVDISLCLAILCLRQGDTSQAREYVRQGLGFFDRWDEHHYLKLMLFQEHLLMIDEVYFGATGVLPRVEAFYQEHCRLVEKGVKVHFLSRSLREGVLQFMQQRSRGSLEEARETLHKTLELFHGELPLCAIFHNIKRPSLEEILGIYLKPT
jgi:tetratricopeptide (TPR) repeat protein